MRSQREDIGGLGNLLFKEAYLYAQVREGNIPDLFLQDEKYFKKYADEIKQRFGARIGKIEKTAVHIRRGDYMGNPFYVDLFRDFYYERAMREFPGEPFLVFSDDIEWCKKQDLFRGSEFSEGKTEVEDLNLMASCTNHIIANSSFSWWGAYLSPHNGRVIAPRKWHSDGVERTVLPSNWVLL